MRHRHRRHPHVPCPGAHPDAPHAIVCQCLLCLRIRVTSLCLEIDRTLAEIQRDRERHRAGIGHALQAAGDALMGRYGR